MKSARLKRVEVKIEWRSRMKKRKMQPEYFLTKQDYKYLIWIIGIYALISFINLGSFKSPSTFWEAEKAEEYALVTTAEPTAQMSKVRVFRGYSEGKGIIAGSLDGNKFETIAEIEDKNVFLWLDFELEKPYQYIGFFAKEEGYCLGEVALYDEIGNQLSLSAVNIQAASLIDEPKEIPDNPTFLDSTYFDEAYFARAAYEYTHDLPVYEYTHPPLGKLIMTVPVWFLGFNPFSYRFMGNLAGILMLIVVYCFGKKLVGNTRYAVLATMLLALDGMHFVQTRIGTVDSFLVLFTLSAYLGMTIYWKQETTSSFWNKAKWLLFSGSCMGMAIATKWTGFYAALGLCILFFINFFARNKQNEEIWQKQRMKMIGWCMLAFGVVPFIIYIASYLPFLRHYNLTEGIQELLKLQKEMFSYHSQLDSNHDFHSKWYLWPLGYKMIWYYRGSAVEGNWSNIFLMGNPIIWWPAFVGVCYSCIRAWRKRESTYIILSVAILTAYLPYAVISRGMFLYHYFPVLPLTLLNLALIFQELREQSEKQVWVRVYMAVVGLSFLLLYPLYSGVLISDGWSKLAVWFASGGIF